MNKQANEWLQEALANGEDDDSAAQWLVKHLLVTFTKRECKPSSEKLSEILDGATPHAKHQRALSFIQASVQRQQKAMRYRLSAAVVSFFACDVLLAPIICVVVTGVVNRKKGVVTPVFLLLAMIVGSSL
jgi:hypothetical protein